MYYVTYAAISPVMIIWAFSRRDYARLCVWIAIVSVLYFEPIFRENTDRLEAKIYSYFNVALNGCETGFGHEEISAEFQVFYSYAIYNYERFIVKSKENISDNLIWSSSNDLMEILKRNPRTADIVACPRSVQRVVGDYYVIELLCG